MRQTGLGPALFERCDFSNAKLNHVEFTGAQLIDCKFAGQLNGVVFHAHSLFHEKGFFPANEMLRVDMRNATLHVSEFRGLDLFDVRWPENGIVLDDYKGTLDRVLAALNQRSDLPSQRLAAVLGSNRKWAGPNQKQGFVSGADLLESYGPDGIELFRRLAKGEEPS